MARRGAGVASALVALLLAAPSAARSSGRAKVTQGLNSIGDVHYEKARAGALEHDFYCMIFHILGRIIPTDELIFSEGLKSPTRRFNHHGELGSNTGI